MEEVFLKTIRQEPDNPTHRLIYGDWLQEQGDSKGFHIATFESMYGKMRGKEGVESVYGLLSDAEDELIDDFAEVLNSSLCSFDCCLYLFDDAIESLKRPLIPNRVSIREYIESYDKVCENMLSCDTSLDIELQTTNANLRRINSMWSSLWHTAGKYSLHFLLSFRADYLGFQQEFGGYNVIGTRMVMLSYGLYGLNVFSGCRTNGDYFDRIQSRPTTIDSVFGRPRR